MKNSKHEPSLVEILEWFDDAGLSMSAVLPTVCDTCLPSAA